MHIYNVSALDEVSGATADKPFSLDVVNKDANIDETFVGSFCQERGKF